MSACKPASYQLVLMLVDHVDEMHEVIQLVELVIELDAFVLSFARHRSLKLRSWSKKRPRREWRRRKVSQNNVKV